MKHDGDSLRSYLDQNQIGKTDTATKLGMTKQGLYQLFKSKEFGPDTAGKLDRVLGSKWREVKVVNVSRETARAKTSQDAEVIKSPDANLQGLIESNKVLSEANKTLADAHYILAKGNEELIQMLKVSFGNILKGSVAPDPTGIQEGHPAKGDLALGRKKRVIADNGRKRPEKDISGK